MLEGAYGISGYCRRCGYCEPICPTILAFGNSPVHGPRGRMLLSMELRAGGVRMVQENVEPFFSCLSCDACKEVCPAGLSPGEVSRLMRAEAFANGIAPGLAYVVRDAFVAKGDPLGIGIASWRPRNLPAEGKYLLFTGGLYQLMAYSESAISILKWFKDEPGLIRLSLKTGIAQLFVKMIARKDYFEALDSIAMLLSRSGVYYRPELDAYSGALAYDLGMEEEFAEHAKKVARGLAGKKVVVIDPHTAYTLSEVYPKYVDGFEVEVMYYTELLDMKSFKFHGKVSYQEPCYLLRHFKKEGIRPVLESIEGIELEKVKASCCGGPIEFLFAEQSTRIAKRRGEGLGAQQFITACPVCMASFRRAGYKPVDLSSFLNSRLDPH